MKPRTVGLRELKTHLSKYISEVKEGNTVLISVRGRTVGRITPVQTVSKTDPLTEAGLALWSGKKFLPKVKPLKTKGDQTITNLLLEERR